MENDVNDAQAVNKGTLAPGTMLDHYRLGKCLGVGGMGEVYFAVHEVLETPCAIKIIRPQIAQESPDVAARLIREARMACRIQHDNIVGVLDASSTSNLGCPYIVMEYVDGVTVEKYLESGPMPEEDVIAVAQGVTEALIAAAKYKVVHRDIKPANIMIDSRGQVKLADLGIAKSDTSIAGGTLTQENALLGTPSYAAPEQLRSSHSVDARADIYSLGATMYHMLTGRRPFDGDTVYSVIAQVVCDEPPTFKELGVKISPALSELVEKMMSKDPEKRPPSAWALRGLLEKAAKGGRSSRFAMVPKKQLNLVLALALAASACAVLCFKLFNPVPDGESSDEGAAPVVSSAPAPASTARSSAPAPAPRPAAPAPASAARSSAPAPAARPAAPASAARSSAPAPAARPPVPSSWLGSGSFETFEPFNLSLEERLAKARERLSALKAALNSGAAGARRSLINEQIAFREEQIRFMEERLRIRKKQRNRSWSSSETEALKKEIEDYLEKRRNGGWSSRDSEFGKKVAARLRSGRIDVDMTLRAGIFPGGSGSLLAAVLSRRLQPEEELLRALVEMNADFSAVGKIKIPISPTKALFKLMLPVLTDHIDSFQGNSSNLTFLLHPTAAYGPDGALSFGKIDSETVREMILLGCAVNFKTAGQGQTPLHLAAFAGESDLVKLLLLADASPDRENNFGQTPLFAAAMSGNDAVYDLMLKFAADPGKKDIFGKTAGERKWDGILRQAVLSGNSAEALRALRNKADPNALFGSFRTNLDIACSRKDAALVKLLLQYGADPNPRTETWMTPLFMVSPEQRGADLEIFKLLVEHGAETFISSRGRSYSMLSRLLMRFCYNDSRVRQDYDKYLAFLKYMLACGKFDMDPQYLSMVSFRCPYPAVLAAVAAHAPMPDDMRARSFLRSVLQRRMPKSVIKPLLERGIVPPEGAQLFMLLRANNFADVIELFRGKLPDSQIDELLKDADKRDSDSVAGQGMFSPGNPNRAR